MIAMVVPIEIIAQKNKITVINVSPIRKRRFKSISVTDWFVFNFLRVTVVISLLKFQSVVSKLYNRDGLRNNKIANHLTFRVEYLLYFIASSQACLDLSSEAPLTGK
jgi:hypothetical protein